MSPTSAMIITLFGVTINLMSVMIICMIIGLITMFWRIQRSQKLDFTDVITKDGHTVSLTKVLQLIGGMTATWVIIKMTMGSTLTSEIFAIYLTYVASIEGFSKFMVAKYGYQEHSVRNPAGTSPAPSPAPTPPQKDEDEAPTGRAKAE